MKCTELRWSTASSWGMLRYMAYCSWGVLLGVAFAACGSGCSDPGPDSNTSERIAPGQPEVELGSVTDAGYQPLAAEPAVPVIWGAQGGTWIMPVLRVRGIASPTLVAGTLVLTNGEVLGETEVRVPLEHREGWLESQRFAVPVQHAPPHEYDPVDDVYGQGATLSVKAWDDDGRSADHEVSVLLSAP